MAGPTLAMLEREKAFQVKKMPSEGMSLAERRERRQGKQGRACLWGKLPGKRRNPTSQESSPGQMKGARRGTGHPQRRNDVRGSGGREGPHLPGSTWRQNGRGREAAGVRYLRSEDEEAGAGPGPGAVQSGSPAEGDLP